MELFLFEVPGFLLLGVFIVIFSLVEGLVFRSLLASRNMPIFTTLSALVRTVIDHYYRASW